MQMSLTSAANQKYFWAFAKDSEPPTKRYRPSLKPRRNLGRYVITSCSRQAKAYGIKIGMNYAEAKQLVPGMRVLIYNR